jgi:hypothetical protein
MRGWADGDFAGEDAVGADLDVGGEVDFGGEDGGGVDGGHYARYVSYLRRHRIKVG